MVHPLQPRMALLASAVALTVLTLAGCGSKPTAAGERAVTDGSASSLSTSTPAEGTADPAAASPKILDFSATTVTGASFAGSSLAGKPAVLWFWAPWCPTCRGQIKGVSDLAQKYGAKVNFVGVGSLDKASAIKGFADDVPAKMPHLQDPDGKVWRHFGIVEQSTYVVLDANSKVVADGYLDDSDLKDLVTKLAG